MITPVIVGAVLLFLLLLFGFSEIRQSREPKKATQKSGNLSNNPQVQVDSLEAAQEKHRAAEREYWADDIAIRSQPNWLGRFTAVFSTVAAVAAVAGYIDVRRQANEAERQTAIAKASLIAQNRAWIDFSFKPETVALTWTKEGHGVLYIELTAVNKGNSPALNTAVYPIVFIEPLGANGMRTNVGMLNNALDRCNSYLIGWGNALFGGNPVENSISADFGPGIIADYSKSREASLGKKNPDFILRAPPFRVEICAIYRIIGEDTVHKTVRTYDLSSVVASRPITVGVDVGPGQLILLNDTEIDYAD